MTTAICWVLRAVHDGEKELERELHAVGQRHRTDHEVRHVCVDLARWSLDNRRALLPLSSRYGEQLADDQEPEHPPGGLREKAAELVGRRPEPGLLLLHDLRRLYLLASGNSVHWTMLGQAAQAAKDTELLDVVTQCHERTIRQTTWCNAMVKVLSPQVLTSL